MNREKLIKEIKKEAKAKNLKFQIDKKAGKGSHYIVKVGNKTTTIPKTLYPIIVKAIKQQLRL